MINKLLTIILSTITVMSHAQEAEIPKIQIGVIGGFTNTTIDGPIVDHYAKRPQGELERRRGHTFSLNFRYIFSRLLYSEIAIGYYQKGGYFLNSDYVDDIVMPVNYLNIPIIIGLKTSKNGPVNLSPEIGLSYDIRIGCEEIGCLNLDDTFQCCGPSPTSKDEIGVTFDIQNPVSFVAGARLDIKLTEGIQASGRYRFYDDINHFFGNEKDFSISGKGHSVEIGLMCKVK